MNEINPHEYIMPGGRHAGERLVQVPASYLKWMVNAGHSHAAVAEGELKRRGTVTPDVDISGHAIHRASLLCRKIWHRTKNENEGLHAWLVRVTQEAIKSGEQRNGEVYYMGMKMKIIMDGKWPVLLTVLPR